MDDRTLEQVTVRGSVQSGKTATLLVAALAHFAAGRSVLFFEPDEALKRAMSARVRAWARACRDPLVSEPWATPRPPHQRTNDAGGRLEVLSAGQRTGTLMRTAEIVILDELRAFGRDIVLELVDRMAAYGGKGRLITASSAGEEEACRTTTELEKSDARFWFVPCPACGQSSPVQWSNVVIAKSPGRPPVYAMPCCKATLGSQAFKRAVAAGAWRATRAAAVPATRGYHADCFLSPFETLATITRAWSSARAFIASKRRAMAEVRAFQQGRLALPFKPEPAGGVTPEQIAVTCREAYVLRPWGRGRARGCRRRAGQPPRGRSERLGARGGREGRGRSERDSRMGGRRATTGSPTAESGFGLRRDGVIEYRKIPGDPGTPEPWDELARMMESTARTRERAVMLRPVVVGIDSPEDTSPSRRPTSRSPAARGTSLSERTPANPVRRSARSTVGDSGRAPRLRAERAHARLHERGEGDDLFPTPPVMHRHRSEADVMAG